jgi:HK97 gp10 family phage protein
MSVEIEGLSRLFARLDNIPNNLESKMVEATLFVEGDARERAPKADIGGGFLKGSIESKVERNATEIEGTVFTTAFYAPYQEFGTGLFAVNGDGRKTGWAYEDPKTGETVFTRGNRPHPFMGPAVRENEDTIIQFFKEGVTDV